MGDVREQLQRAYRYIRHDRTQEAQQILRPLLEADSENVHAWWLLAHAVTDPQEIRHALNRVLTLDPAYPNADKARQLLAALDDRYAAAEIEALVLSEDEMFASHEEAEDFAGLEGTFAPPESSGAPFLDYESYERPHSAPEPLDELVFDEAETAQLTRVESAEEDPFAHLEEDLLAEKFEQEDFDTADLIRAIDADQVDLEALLKLEEEEAGAQSRVTVPAHRSRKPGALFWLLAIAIALVGIVVLVFRFVSEGETTPSDPGPLAPMAIEDLTLASVLRDLNSQLSTQGLGQEYRAIVAPSSLGKTLYIEFCLLPQIGLAEAAVRGMDLAARQVPAAANQIDAVGVSINRCQARTHDTLYRAQVSREAAQRYVNGELGTGETGLASFQALWTTS